MKKVPIDPEKNTATVLVLEAIMMCMLTAGASREEAIEGACILFSNAHKEATLLELEQALAEGN